MRRISVGGRRRGRMMMMCGKENVRWRENKLVSSLIESVIRRRRRQEVRDKSTIVCVEKISHGIFESTFENRCDIF